MSLPDVFLVLSAVSFAGLLAVAAIQDARHRTIANWISLGVVASAVVRWVAMGDSEQAFLALGLSSAALGIGFILFVTGAFGGGDVKLFAAALLWVGVDGASAFLLGMAICGAALAGLVAFDASVKGMPIRGDGAVTVPYGVAIALGALTGMLTLSSATLG